jgi:hypothetical protein
LIPELPKKTFMSIFKAKSHEEIDERRIGLEIFMNVYYIILNYIIFYHTIL